MKHQPNILLITTDQQSACALGCAGNPHLKTPAMDGLAAGGVRFDRAYCTQPLCTPSRASLFTGRMPHQCEATANNREISPAVRPRGLGNWLRQAGYECLYGGKWHVAPVAMPAQNDHGFTVLAGFDDNRLAPACTNFFREWTRRPAGSRKPFFVSANFDNPHNICEFARNMPLPWLQLAAPPPPETCPPLPRNFLPSVPEPEIIRIEQGCNFSIHPTLNWTEADWRRLRWAYFRLIEWVDARIQALLDSLSETGLADDTVVIFTSDHGDGHGAHQWNQKSLLYEEVVRIPLIIREPGQAGGRVDGRLVSNGLDLFPTLCAYAGCEPPPDLAGLNLRPLLPSATPSQPSRTGLAIECFFDGGRGYGTTGRAWIESDWKYVVYDKGQNREQLFNLANDPGEMRNLAFDPAFQPQVATARKRLRAACELSADPFRSFAD
jgi:arylsulfatase A-like enzyme